MDPATPYKQEYFVLMPRSYMFESDLHVNPEAYQEPPKEAPKKAGALPKTFVALDHIMDLVPLASTASNLIDLGLKLTVANKTQAPPEESPYLNHLKTKSAASCVLYGIPVLGNVSKLGALAYNFFTAPKTVKPEEKKPLKSSEYGFSTIGSRMSPGREQLIHQNPIYARMDKAKF